MSLLTRFFDPVDADRDHVARKYQFTTDWRAWAVPLGLGFALLLVSLLGLLADSHQFWYAYLIGWTYCLSIALGCLFFVMFQHITKAKWVTAFRRVPELLMANFWLLALLGLPLLFGIHDLFEWSHHEVYEVGNEHYDPILVGKHGYLNVPFFIARSVFYFFVWIVVSQKLYRASVRHDTNPTPETGPALRRTSAWGIPLVAVTMAFASYDYLMSLDPHWFSTIFGVYFFAGGFLTAIAAMTFLGLAFYRTGLLQPEVSKEHFHDLGKYLFAFVVFWTYIAFSQYMLIWYGNLPEETVWFKHRLEHGWEWVTQALIWFHFVLPFFLLLPRTTKRVLPALAVMCGWILVMHWIDLWWVAKPSLYVTTGIEAYAHAALTWVDLTCWLGLLGVVVGTTLWRAGRHSIAPYNDPYFAFSARFENV
ncbi:MAG: hypothetical protein R3362_05435 [Rhodothermales bacterium]|nr:hypothetical protein [Rhodothermales bacterium]